MTTIHRHRFESPTGYLHHRSPYLLIDQIDEIGDEHVTASRTIRGDEDFITGHFPGAPVMPGAMMQEMTTQTGGVLIAANYNPIADYRTDDPNHNPLALGVLVKIKSARYRGFARPGDCLVATATLVARVAATFEFVGRITIGDQTILRNEFQLANIDTSLLRGTPQ